MDPVSSTDEWTPPSLSIPQHWRQLDFEDVFKSVSIASLKVPQKEYLSSGRIPVIDQGAELVGGYTNDESKCIKSTRPLIVFGDHTKCFKLVGFPFAPGADGVKVLEPTAIDGRFAYYACKALRLPDRGYSRHYAFLKKSKIPIAPQKEQLRIVEKIEELFSELDKGVESLRTARRQLKVYRQSVLKHAFEGKLTTQWREENEDKLETPEQLLARIKKERAAHYERQLQEWKANANRGERTIRRSLASRPAKLKDVARLSLEETETLSPLPGGWSYVRLGLVIDEPKYGTSKKCDYNFEGTGVLRIPNVVRGLIDDADLKGASFEDDEKWAYSLRSGDILMIRSNGSISIVGKCALVSSAEQRYLYAGYLIRIRPNPAVVLPEYLAVLISSHLVRVQIEGFAKSTSGVNNINSGEIQSLIVPLCSVQEQQEMVAQLSAMISGMDATTTEIDKQLRTTDTLRQAVLKKAFAGQLVPQDPGDEPASVLLEKIRTERAKAGKGGPTARRNKKAKTAA